MTIIWGIDYGKKMSGNTVICEKTGSTTNFYRAANDSDADAFILKMIDERAPETIFIDAPLSLPGALLNKEGLNNYFYRACDQQLQAMSPMFLGGLTARAIQLKDIIQDKGIDIKETYPKALAKKIGLKSCGYRQGNEYIAPCTVKIKETSLVKIENHSVISWHHLDALLALLSAVRYTNELHITFGDKQEGLIYI